ncbi:hypothetical protein [Halobacillus litoralis]|uniref:hypothetical protein n=1 Tax=Halobacillus litoralis TaxID=45668 RepID=UPI00136F9FEB|nr:hypothetical protein [Halobacillus litoralis]MYL36362.1 hypothetical protein [Halobacillus litoralis]
MVTPAGTARVEDPLGQAVFLTKWIFDPCPRQSSTDKRNVAFNAPSNGKQLLFPQ